MRAASAVLLVAVVLVATAPLASAALLTMGSLSHRNIPRELTSNDIELQSVDSGAVVYVYDGATTSGTAYCTVNGSGTSTCDGVNDAAFPLLQSGSGQPWGVSATLPTGALAPRPSASLAEHGEVPRPTL